MTTPAARFVLPPALDAAHRAALHAWQAQDGTTRLWAKDATLWTDGDEAAWLGWLDVIADERPHTGEIAALAREARAEGIVDAVLLGMGGSSLAPEVLRATFGRVAGALDLHVLDSTDPQQIRAVEARVDLSRTLLIVSSKSGSTLEPNIFKDYFFERLRAVVGPELASRRTVAVTDPGSALHAAAERDGFRHVFAGRPSIGGRYSALSRFGLVPAAVAGIDIDRLLDTAAEMATACRERDAAGNPGVALGTLLGVAAAHGRDKLTILAAPPLRSLGAWLEQLVAESTGKVGKAIVPVDLEAAGPPEVYGTDRVFVSLNAADGGEPHAEALTALARAGHPVVHLAVDAPYGIAAEFMRWEIATAVAGALLGINPFDQPDVEAAKVATKALTSAFETAGTLPAEAPFAEADGFSFFADAANVRALEGATASAVDILRAHLGRLTANDYFAVLGFIEMNDTHAALLQALRHVVRDHWEVATCLGFGPRFLHSTGQAYKGGPNTGVFLQVTADTAHDLAVPGRRYSFGVVEAAQARGDFQVLAERGRRALRVHLHGDVEVALRALNAAVYTAAR